MSTQFPLYFVLYIVFSVLLFLVCRKLFLSSVVRSAWRKRKKWIDLNKKAVSLKEALSGRIKVEAVHRLKLEFWDEIWILPHKKVFPVGQGYRQSDYREGFIVLPRPNDEEVGTLCKGHHCDLVPVQGGVLGYWHQLEWTRVIDSSEPEYIEELRQKIKEQLDLDATHLHSELVVLSDCSGLHWKTVIEVFRLKLSHKPARENEDLCYAWDHNQREVNDQTLMPAKDDHRDIAIYTNYYWLIDNAGGALANYISWNWVDDKYYYRRKPA